MNAFENMTIDAADGPCGRVADVLVDQQHLTLTHPVISCGTTSPSSDPRVAGRQ